MKLPRWAQSLILLAVGVGCLIIADAAWKSITGYQSPYVIKADLAPGEPLTDRLLLIVLDGVRVDAALDMPTLQRMAARGSSGTLTVGMPSLSNPARATMLTGAWPEVHAVTNNGRFRASGVDSIFSLAQRFGVPTAVYGSGFWKRAFGDFIEAGRIFSFDKEIQHGESVGTLVAWQGEVCDHMAAKFSSVESGLLVAGITATDTAGHDFGGESAEYKRLVAVADGCLSLLDDDRTTFVITSDHGQIHRRGQGGHGGSEPEVLQVPVVLVGPGIVPGSSWTGELVDLAPTISALLGLPLPANSQGRVRTDAIEAPPGLADRLAAQRRVANEAMQEKVRLGQLGDAARNLPGLIAFTLLVSVGAPIVYLGGTRVIAAAAVWCAVYATLCRVFGLGYSLSDIVREEYLNSFFLRNIVAAAVGLGAASVAFRSLNPAQVGFLVSSLLGLRVAWIFRRHGLFMVSEMPDLDWAFTAYLDLLAIFGVGLGVVVALNVRRLLERRQRIGLMNLAHHVAERH